MENKLDITVLVPVHELYDETTQDLFGKALSSVVDQETKISKILVVCPDLQTLVDEIEKVASKVGVEIEIVKHLKSTDFCTQVNFGVSKVETKYFSILELDDEYSKTYFNNVKLYSESKEYKDTAMFIPLTVLVDGDGKLIQFINEGVWAQGFSEVHGKLDLNTLLTHNSFMISGAIINKESFEEVGGLKANIKVHFIYEFLLRFINNDHESVVIPKISYKHLINRKGSLFNQYQDASTGIKPEEGKFFLETAKKEYLFNPNEIERDIVYSPADLG